MSKLINKFVLEISAMNLYFKSLEYPQKLFANEIQDNYLFYAILHAYVSLILCEIFTKFFKDESAFL